MDDHLLQFHASLCLSPRLVHIEDKYVCMYVGMYVCMYAFFECWIPVALTVFSECLHTNSDS